MAGYLFTFSNKEYLKEAISHGTYSTYLNLKWNQATEGTLGDYVTMKPGDNVYFFSQRIIYGIGKIVEIFPGITVAENYERATLPAPIDEAFIKRNSLTKKPIAKIKDKNGKLSKDRKLQRWVIAFEGDPAFFVQGIDMDDMLKSNDRAFRSLRIFWRRSFIKLDDQENLAFKTAILRRNAKVIENGYEDGVLQSNLNITLQGYKESLGGRNPYPRIDHTLANKRKKNGALRSEALLEVGLLWQLSNHDKTTLETLGKWDYISHQVHASPMKAIDYMDKMDIFAYRYIPGFKPIIGQYCVMELKKDKVVAEDLQQVLKYVDWCCNEYADGDYSLVTAYLIGHDFDLDAIEQSAESITRNYTVGTKPAHSAHWRNLSFVTYEVKESGHILLNEIMHATCLPSQ